MQTHNERAFILDFVGRGQFNYKFTFVDAHASVGGKPSDLNIVLLDVAIFILQLVQVFIAFELPCDPDVLNDSPSSPLRQFWPVLLLTKR